MFLIDLTCWLEMAILKKKTNLIPVHLDFNLGVLNKATNFIWNFKYLSCVFALI